MRIERILITAIRFEVYTIMIVRDVTILLEDVVREYTTDPYFTLIVVRLKYK